MTATDTTTLTQWLTVQLDADEAAARAACEEHLREWEPYEWQPPADKPKMVTRWQVVSVAGKWGSHDAQFVEAFLEFPYGGERRVVDHIARYDPARVLAEVAAKRAIVEMATNQHTSSPDFNEAVRALASVYADQPGFREEWRG